MEKSLVLTGMMGVVKSTIRRLIAKRLKAKFIDVDKIIEKKEGCSISSIFKNKSEDYFRKLENDVTQHELKKKNSVISLGGGAFLNASIRKNVKNTSVSFWIDVSTEILIKRLYKSKKRPLLYHSIETW